MGRWVEQDITWWSHSRGSADWRAVVLQTVGCHIQTPLLESNVSLTCTFRVDWMFTVSQYLTSSHMKCTSFSTQHILYVREFWSCRHLFLISRKVLLGKCWEGSLCLSLSCTILFFMFIGPVGNTLLYFHLRQDPSSASIQSKLPYLSCGSDHTLLAHSCFGFSANKPYQAHLWFTEPTHSPSTPGPLLAFIPRPHHQSKPHSNRSFPGR